MSDFNDILDTDLKSEYKLVKASKGKRFANFLIDILFFYILLFALVMGSFIFTEAILDLVEKETNPFVDRVLSAIILAIYYIIIESTLKGKTIGKFITKTRTVNLDGSRPDFQTIVLRSLSRIVPFDAFSFLGDDSNGWHDKWTKTIVIDEQLSQY